MGLLDDVLYARGPRQRKKDENVSSLLPNESAGGLLGRAAMMTAPVPVVGDVMGLAADAHRYATEPEARTPGNLGLSALGLLPFVPGMTVWHGSPHKFDKFDISKIGSGQGAQSYGHGLYVAENRSVANSPEYRTPEAGYKRLSGHLSPIEEFAHDMAATGKSNDDVWGAMVQKYGRDASATAPFQDAYDAAIAAKGNLYKVDLPDEHIAKMLDWDAPLSNQSEAIQTALKNIGIGNKWNESGLRGSEIYKRLVHKGDSYKTLGNTAQAARADEKAASDTLRSLGIPGIKYLDGGSRGKGDGTRNFVVFDDELLKILGRE